MLGAVVILESDFPFKIADVFLELVSVKDWRDDKGRSKVEQLGFLLRQFVVGEVMNCLLFLLLLLLLLKRLLICCL
jgi:hypothetical protein